MAATKPLVVSGNKLPEGVYMVDRLVQKRVRKVYLFTYIASSFLAYYIFEGVDEYLVLWKGYRRSESTWVSAKNITTLAIKYVAKLKFNCLYACITKGTLIIPNLRLE